MGRMEPFASAQNDLFVRLRTRPALKAAGVDVQQMRPRSEAEAAAIVTGINNVLAGLANVSGGARSGLAVLVALPGFENRQNNLPGIFGEMVFSVVVLENILQNMGPNGTGMSCEEAATHVMLAGHQFLIADGRALACDGMEPMNVDQQEFQADVAYEIKFRCPAGWTQEPECAMPTVTVGEASISVSCATPAAQIWVTLDGSMPEPANPTAFQASGPFDYDGPPCVLRAAAYHESLNPSSPLWKRI